MCGIVASGCINENIYQILLNGLKQLQNRGYDSAGISIIKNNNFKTIKKASSNNLSAIEYLEKTEKIENVENVDKNKSGDFGIGHTRWATHGAKTDTNSHPHFSNDNKFAIVHNGIIENYKELKAFLENIGYQMQSETDTEIIVNYISYFYKELKDVKMAIKETVQLLEGTWGIVIMCLDTPNTLYCTRHGSPLLVGYTDTMALVVSEQSGFCNKFQNYFVLDNYDICTITKKNVQIVIDTQKEYELKKIIKNSINYIFTPEPYPHWMLKEICEQTQSIKRVIKLGSRILGYNKSVHLGGLNQNMNILKDMENIILLGCGTSYNACHYSLNFFKQLTKFKNIQIIDGADFTHLDLPKNCNGNPSTKTCLVLCSQSGETKDLHRCIKIAKEHNIFIIGVVNVVDSLISREVDCGCYLHAGREVAVASTKSFTSQALLLTIIALWFSEVHYPTVIMHSKKTIIADIRKLTENIKELLDDSMHKKIKELTKYFKNKNSCFILGKGNANAIANEGALKIKEISYIHAEGYSTSSLKHGPFALLEPDFPVILLCANDEHYSKTLNAYEEIKSRHASIIVITDDENFAEKNADKIIVIPKNDTFSHLLMTIPLQLLSYELALMKGNNPDMPRNLAKVVTVE